MSFVSFFSQNYLEVVHREVIATVCKKIFISGWILPNYNASTLILIAKTQKSDSVKQ